MSNPYSAKRSRVAVTAKGRTPITAAGFKEAPKAGSIDPTTGRVRLSDTTRLVNDKGEFNGNNKRDVMQAISLLKQSISKGQISVTSKASSEVQAEHERVLAEAWSDKSGAQWQALGEVVGENVAAPLA